MDPKGNGTERLAAFSDGVIAIIITIMVLELKLPETASHGAVMETFIGPLAPKLAAYALSFLIVGTMWVNHHHLIMEVRRVTGELLWLNLLLLFFMSIIPLATGFLGEHPLLPRAVAFYAIVLALSSAVFSVLRYRLGRMPEHDQGHPVFRMGTVRRSVASTLLYALAAAVATVSPLVAAGMVAFVPLMFNLPLVFSAR